MSAAGKFAKPNGLPAPKEKREESTNRGVYSLGDMGAFPRHTSKSPSFALFIHSDGD
jgi:hypothetical protein